MSACRHGAAVLLASASNKQPPLWTYSPLYGHHLTDIFSDTDVGSQVYHVSRESFLYLSEFYIGEIAPEDRPLVPVVEVRVCECMSVQACTVTLLHDPAPDY